MPVAAEIVPELLMPPEKVPTPSTKMPAAPAEIVPELVMPPPALLLPNWATPLTTIPLLPAVIVPEPELLMPSEKVLTRRMSMAVDITEIVPELVMPPPALLLPNWVTLLRAMPTAPAEEIVPELLMPPENELTKPREMPMCSAEIVPALEMPPVNVGLWISMAMPLPLSSVILLVLSSEMPPMSVLELKILPVMVLLVTLMPELVIGPIAWMEASMVSLSTQTPETLLPLLKKPLPPTGVHVAPANAADMPPAISSTAKELDVSRPSLRFCFDKIAPGTNESVSLSCTSDRS
jgi:hypothetical protein